MAIGRKKGSQSTFDRPRIPPFQSLIRHSGKTISSKFRHRSAQRKIRALATALIRGEPDLPASGGYFLTVISQIIAPHSRLRQKNPFFHVHDPETSHVAPRPEIEPFGLTLSRTRGRASAFPLTRLLNSAALDTFVNSATAGVANAMVTAASTIGRRGIGSLQRGQLYNIRLTWPFGFNESPIHFAPQLSRPAPARPTCHIPQPRAPAPKGPP
jgi:hypothetical protein